MKPTVSVVVLTFNSAQTVKATLNGILQQKFADPLEIAVIDDGSTDKTPELCKALGIPFHRNEKSVGLAGSINRGINMSQADIIVTLHGDAVPLSEHWLSDLVEPLRHKGIAATCSLQHSPKIDRDNISIWEKFLWGKVTPHHALNNKGDAYKRSALEQIGLFDEITFRTAGEDEDVSLRLRLHGWDINETGAELRHDHRYSSSSSRMIFKDIMRKEYNYGRSGGALRRKFPRHKLGAYVYPKQKSAYSDGLVRSAVCLGSVTPFLQWICIPVLGIASVSGVERLAAKTQLGLYLLGYPLFNIVRYWSYAIGYLHGFASGRQR